MEVWLHTLFTRLDGWIVVVVVAAALEGWMKKEVTKNKERQREEYVTTFIFGYLKMNERSRINVLYFAQPY